LIYYTSEPALKVFTFTTGRSGTAYLAECFKLNAPECWIVEHEGPFYGGFGIFRPDISHLHAYNLGNRDSHLRDFWKRKFDYLPKDYVETAHINCKAGLIENLDLLKDEVGIIHLKRNVKDTIRSMIARGSFIGKSDMWVWHLDPEYPNNLVDYRDFDSGPLGCIGWYLVEMEARAKKLRNTGNAKWIDVQLENIVTIKGLTAFLKQFELAFTELPGVINANPVLDFEPDLLLAIDNLAAEVERRISEL
jgi:hypothetical protein